MRNYELMYILQPTLEGEEKSNLIESLHKILTDNGAKITGVKDWGLRDLAYPIKKQTKGTYIITTFTGEPIALKEFDRIVRLNQNVLRFLITVSEN